MMTKEQAEKAAVWLKALNASGYAGVLPSGKIVDRREYPKALPIQKNELLGVPEPRKVFEREPG
jgi:hypothetical protein